MLNNITLHGRLTKDVELRYTNSNKAVGSFTIACDRPGKDKGADFINCVAWEQTAQMIEKWFHKGSEIVLSGRLQSRQYEDKSGSKRTAYEVVVSSVDFCGKREDAVTVSAPSFEELDDGDGDLPF